MAILWVSRKLSENDPLKAAMESLKQALVEGKARNRGLNTEYEVEDNCIDLAVEGDAGAITALLKEIYQETGICGFVVDVESAEERRVLDEGVRNTPTVLAEIVDI